MLLGSGFVFGAICAAQPPGSGGREGGGRGPGGPPSVIARALDSNHDNTLSAEEIAAAPKSLLTLDKNGDGALTPDELQPRREGGPGGEAGRPGAGGGAELDESTPSPDDLAKQLMAFDKNHDGVLTPDELPERLQSLFTRADANHDGKLTPTELRTLAAKQAPPPAPPEREAFRDPLVTALDTNHDGTLSAAEIAAAGTTLLTLDANHDGQLTSDEMRPRPPAPAEQAAHLIAESDKNSDGKLSRSEAPDFLQGQFERIDTNADGLIDRDELAAFLSSNNFGPRGRTEGDGERRSQARPDSAAPLPPETRKP